MLVPTERRRENDDVALVTLYVLDVLYEETHVFAAFGSLTLAHKRVAEGSVVLRALFKRVFDRVRLFTVECDDANRGRRRIFPEVEQIFDDVCGFLGGG